MSMREAYNKNVAIQQAQRAAAEAAFIAARWGKTTRITRWWGAGLPVGLHIVLEINEWLHWPIFQRDLFQMLESGSGSHDYMVGIVDDAMHVATWLSMPCHDLPERATWTCVVKGCPTLVNDENLAYCTRHIRLEGTPYGH
jgi:hypothetical protein